MGKRKLTGYWLFALECKYYLLQNLPVVDIITLNYVASNIWPYFPEGMKLLYKDKSRMLTHSNNPLVIPYFLSKSDFELLLHLRCLSHVLTTS